jgi:hypothetical protein
VPELQRRGLYRKDYSGPTLRDHLGQGAQPPAATVSRGRAASAS